MIRRLMIMVWVAAALFMLTPGCGEDESQKSTAPPPEKTTTAGPETVSKTESRPPEKKNVWPYLSQDYKVALADDLLAKNYVLIFDGSGSMGETDCGGGRAKIIAAREAVMEWSKTVPGSANLGLVSFHAGGEQMTVLDLGVGNREEFIKTIQRIQAGGKTPLTNAFKQAFLILEKQAQSQLGYGEYVIVVVTDGIANNPNNLTSAVGRILKSTPIDIYTIGFCISGTHSLNQKGRTMYRSADNPEQLRQGLKEVLAETEEFDIADFN